MPLTRRLPKRGFNNAEFKKDWEIVNLVLLIVNLNTGSQVTKEILIEKGIIRGKSGSKLKVLAHGELTKKLLVYADAFSATAADAITKQGGEVHVTKEM